MTTLSSRADKLTKKLVRGNISQQEARLEVIRLQIAMKEQSDITREETEALLGYAKSLTSNRDRAA